MTEFVQPGFRSSLFFAIGWIMMVLVSGSVASLFAFGRTITEKFVTALIMPCGLVWLLLLTASLLAFFLKCRAVSVVTFLTFCLLTCLAGGHLSSALVERIESPFREIKPLEQRPFAKVIVLGGGGKLGTNGRAQGNTSGDRLILAASLYHQALTKTVVCTGSRIKGLGDNQPGPAEISASVLKALGVPDGAIEYAEGRTTSEELVNLSQNLNGENQRIGIVTSAWHLQRVLKLASSRKIKLYPLPSDFLGGPDEPMSMAEQIKAFIPDANNLVMTSHIIKEYLAMAVGR